MIFAKPHHGYREVEMAGFNTLIWNTKDSARGEYPPIEKADEKHKRDLFRRIGHRLEGASEATIQSFMGCTAPQSRHFVTGN
jgi:hypothetical protein